MVLLERRPRYAIGQHVDLRKKHPALRNAARAAKQQRLRLFSCRGEGVIIGLTKKVLARQVDRACVRTHVVARELSTLAHGIRRCVPIALRKWELNLAHDLSEIAAIDENGNRLVTSPIGPREEGLGTDLDRVATHGTDAQ